MLQELLARLTSSDASPRALAVALVVAGAGLALWAAGARFGRSIFALVGVAAGALAGLHGPRWMGWEIDTMGTAIGGALALGLAGYLLHALWTGLTLSTLLACAGAVVAWHRLAGATAWSPPAIDPSATLVEVLQAAWHSLPGAFSRALPYVLGGCFAAGSLLAWLLPALGRVLAFSLLGSALLGGGGLAAVALARPEWFAHLPASAQTWAIALAALVMVGAAIQWASRPRRRKPALELRDTGGSGSPPAPARAARDVRDLGSTPLGPLKLKEARA